MLEGIPPQNLRDFVGDEKAKIGLAVSLKTLGPRSTTSSPVIMIPRWLGSSMLMPTPPPARASWAIICLPIVGTTHRLDLIQ
jgi:hypothetical protein